MSGKRDKALTILAGCHNGATELTLANHGISRATLDALVAEGRITHTVETMANPKGLKVDRFKIAKDQP
jgi:hypothetical protein